MGELVCLTARRCAAPRSGVGTSGLFGGPSALLRAKFIARHMATDQLPELTLAQIEAARDVPDLVTPHLSIAVRIQDISDTLAVALDEP
ncbi:hypothetical protein WME97_33310 [Sorangium sp. So ce367]|uniref:hypothetical protein n=1 Tax=Sorangium sp. So ce367 TaxID=3133305 RepID=UPI003F645C1E